MLRPIDDSLTIFLIGATGDLAKKKIWAAVYRLYEQSLLPKNFKIVGVARTEFSSNQFQQLLIDVIRPTVTDQRWNTFLESVSYISGDVSKVDTFKKLCDQHTTWKTCGNHLWYVATLPNLYLSVIKHIKATQLQQTNCGWTKLLLEKPFGVDLQTSQKLNTELLQVFDEEQIYRIDHFLAKETVQNLLIFRFGNGLFEHLWNSSYVDHIQITASEKFGIGTRGAFYDAVGTVRDVVQNHVLQMLAMTMMEEPQSLEPSHIRKKRMDFLSQLEILSPEFIPSSVYFGQYSVGIVDGETTPSYLNELGIPDTSRTETAVAGKIHVNSPRWKGVPIYFRAGKRLAETVTEISIKFKEPINKMFSQLQSPQTGNVLTLRIQPNEGVIVRLNVKKPGLSLSMEEVSMQFCYKSQFQMGLVEAYEKLLYDAIQGDTTLFPQAEDIEASWKFIQPIIDHLALSDTRPQLYPGGSWGPESFTELVEQDGRSWIQPQPDTCAV
ncbi:MAG: glucose-6-phosphate 1-dehydrogenase [Patescibacteria group bacterium]|nr:glucose-6-phosphate 1-dehydrogenase [Patescibacteria group bacterium]